MHDTVHRRSVLPLKLRLYTNSSSESSIEGSGIARLGAGLFADHGKREASPLAYSNPTVLRSARAHEGIFAKVKVEGEGETGVNIRIFNSSEVPELIISGNRKQVEDFREQVEPFRRCKKSYIANCR